MNKMTSDQYWEILRQQMLEAAQGILDESVDVSKSCTVVYNFIWAADEYCKKIDEKDALYLKGIWSELEEFPKDEERLNYTPEALSALDEKEREKVEWYKDDLKDICRKILASDIPNMGPSDPYDWPSDEQLKIWNNKK